MINTATFQWLPRVSVAFVALLLPCLGHAQSPYYVDDFPLD